MPYVSSIEEAQIAIKNLIAAVTKAQPPSPYSLKDEQIQELKQLSKLFKKINETFSEHRVMEQEKSNTQQRLSKGIPRPHSYVHQQTPTHRYPTRNKSKPIHWKPSRKNQTNKLTKNGNNTWHYLEKIG